MTVTRGLIIADPWIGYILDGRKTWEMRSQATSVRGWLALIRKGSGTIVGLARLVECGKALDQAEMLAACHHHCIPESMIRRGEVSKWVVPWKMADVCPLTQPVSYKHLSGAVTWVTLTSEVRQQLTPYVNKKSQASQHDATSPARTIKQVSSLSTPARIEIDPSNRPTLVRAPSPPIPEGKGKVLGQSVLSGGNIRNHHIKLSPILAAFPCDVIGGKNKSEVAPRSLVIDWGGPDLVTTDIDGSKCIFRARGWVRRFFEASRAQEGDVVIFSETAPYRVAISLSRANKGG
jgi:hypothetical protein